MSLVLSSLLAMQAGSVLAGMSDAQLCEVMRRNVDTQPAQEVPPLTLRSPSADCRAKRIRATIDVAATGVQFAAIHQAFVANARTGVCNLSNPTMATFHQRGWRFAYRFVAADGTEEAVTLEC